MIGYVNVQLKRDRLEVLYPFDSFTFHEEDWPDREALNRYFDQEDIEVVINLADPLGFVKVWEIFMCIVIRMIKGL